MRKMVRFGWCLAVFVATLDSPACLAAQSAAHTQEQAAAGMPKTAEQQFKNIQVLKNIPAEQLIPTMQFIAVSLGVECEFCHVERQMEKDDKKEKQTARKMIAMELAIDKDHFDGELQVTCYTCHRGSAHPVATPVLSAEAAQPATQEHKGEAEHHSTLPSADEILNKYLAAVGGVDALRNVKTRVQKGSIDAMGHQSPIEVYSEAPDKRVSISHLPEGNSVTAFNGQAGWLSMQIVHHMTRLEREAARIDASIYFPLTVREMYKEFHVYPGDTIDGQGTYMLAASGGGEHPPLHLYFDQQTGLLSRQIRYVETPLGPLPTQIDYADYRQTNGVKIPYQWTLVRNGASFTIHITEVQQNVPIDEKLFVPPSEGQGK